MKPLLYQFGTEISKIFYFENIRLQQAYRFNKKET